MKLFKKITGAVVAIALVLSAVFAFAFSGKKEVTDTVAKTTQFWVFKGHPYDPTLPSSYREAELEDEPCAGSLIICGINAQADVTGDHPIISTNLETKIINMDTFEDEVVLRN